MRNLLVAVFAGALSVAEVGCLAPVSIQPGLAAVRIYVRAKPKSGARQPSSGGYNGGGGGLPNVGPYARVVYSVLDDIVVWVSPTASASSAGTPPAIVVVIGRDPASPLVATGVGGSLTVRNEGSAAERVYSVSDQNVFDLGEIPPGGEARHVLRAAGVVELLGTTRRDPIATVYVAPTPLVQRVRSGRRVVFTDLPPGRCRIECWHPRLPGSRATVILSADQVTEARLSVGVNELPEIP